ncbi:MAG: YihA family ribosome biogenesis GTP-binding protein [Nitrospirae bacterium]|nr:MAG: YihA family ribosome biogenesis GTP-binding protein [Nitrospirota bacterium]
MKILAADFVRSCLHPEEYPRERFPEIAFVGRSNVGKSSLLNSLVQRKGLAKISATPGKTRHVNFFRVATNDPILRVLYFVDLPGYGYAHISKAFRAQWVSIVDQYFQRLPAKRVVLFVLDCRGLSPLDQTTFAWLTDQGITPLLLATKVDKLPSHRHQASVDHIRQSLAIGETIRILTYSSRTHEGRVEVWGAIRERMMMEG